ncbi:MAG: fatty acid CoA ligase family protein [Myxococcota bacterium]
MSEESRTSSGLNAADYLRAHAQSQPNTPALIMADKRGDFSQLTFGELDKLANRYARGLSERGLRPGDRCLFLMRPDLTFYAVWFSLMRLGAVPVVLDPGMGVRALLQCIARAQARALFGIAPVHVIRLLQPGPFRSCELLITKGRRWFWGGLTLEQCCSDDDAPFDGGRFDPDAEAAIPFTSGSTGPAKGVRWTQGMFDTQIREIAAMFDLKPGMTTVECFGSFAIHDICIGMTTVIPRMNLAKPASAKPEDILHAIRTHSPQVSLGSPIIWENLTRHCLQAGQTVEGVETVMTLGAPISMDLQERFRAVFGAGCAFHTPYGATECLPVASIGSPEVLGETLTASDQGAGICVGRPIAAADVQILRITDATVSQWSEDDVLGVGEIGEVCVRGPMASPLYIDNPDATARAKIPVKDGTFFHRMGDLGYVDDRGRLWFCGRKSHRLQTAAGMLPAVPLEGIFNRYPGVRRTAVVGLGASGAETPTLIVEPLPGVHLTADDHPQILALADGTRWAGRIQTVLTHRGFPVDPRHNSKIRRGQLKTWAQSR